jgi:hypothetical protein
MSGWLWIEGFAVISDAAIAAGVFAATASIYAARSADVAANLTAIIVQPAL